MGGIIKLEDDMNAEWSLDGITWFPILNGFEFGSTIKDTIVRAVNGGKFTINGQEATTFIVKSNGSIETAVH